MNLLIKIGSGDDVYGRERKREEWRERERK